MPSLRDQVQAILDRHNASSCVLPALEHVLPEAQHAANTTNNTAATEQAERADRYQADRTAEVCTAARALYAEDARLWAKHCPV